MPPPPWFDDTQVRDLWRALRGYVRRNLRPREQADDIVQEALLRALRAPPEEYENAQSWLRVVAQRLIVDEERSRQSRERREHAVARSEHAWATQDPDWANDVPGIRSALESLREPYREVVLLRYWDGFETNEIAARLGRPEGTIRSQLKRGLDLLRERLGVPRADPRRRRFALVPWWWPSRSKHRVSASGARRLAWVGGVCAVTLISVWTLLDSRSIAAGSPTDSVAAIVNARGIPPSAESLASGDADLRPVSNRAAAGVEASAIESRLARASAHLVRGHIHHRADDDAIVGARMRAASEDLARVWELGVSDANGDFAVSLPELPVWLWAEPEDCAPTARKLLDRGFVELDRPLTLETISRGRMTGIVTGPLDQPVAGARVVLSTLAYPHAIRDAHGVLELAGPPVVATTDGSGRFCAPKPASGRVRVEASADGFATRSEVFAMDATASEIRLEIAGANRRQSRDADCGLVEAGFAGAAQTVWADGSSAGPRHEPMSAAAADSVAGGASVRGLVACALELRGPGIDLRLDRDDSRFFLRVRRVADERFRFDGLAAGGYTLYVEGGGAHGASKLASFELASEEHRDLGTVVAPAPGSVIVQAAPIRVETDAPSSLTFVGADTVLRFAFHQNGLGIEFDRERGRIAVRAVWPGDYRLFVSGPRMVDEAAACEVREASETRIDLDLEPAVRTFVRAMPARPLGVDERWSVFVRSSTGVSELEGMDLRFNTHPDGALTFHAGLAPDVESIEIRTSLGLSGELSLVGRSESERKQIEIALH